MDPTLPLQDCPLGLNEERPSHKVMQVLAGTLYEWREYEFVNAAGERQRALLLLRPKRCRLPASRARLLLTASRVLPGQERSCRHSAGIRPRPVNAPAVRRPGGAAARPRPAAAFLDDERTRITFPQVASYPCNTVAYLESEFGLFPFRGTGFLVAPACLLTAAHMLYDDNGAAWAERVTIYPAQWEDWEGLHYPYGRRTVVEEMRIDPGYYNGWSGCYDGFDLGCLLLKQPFPGIDSFMPLEFDAPLPAKVETYGYPAATWQNPESYAMWHSSGAVLPGESAGERILAFAGYVSPGTSGAPLIYRVENQPRIIGVATCEGTTSDLGVRFTSANEALIREWLRAGTELSEGTEPEGDGYVSYIPYYETGGGAWTGIGLAHPGADSNRVRVEYFSPDGAVAGSQELELPPYGQNAVLCTPEGSTSGWIRLTSRVPVYGIALVGSSRSPATMYDMTLQVSLHRRFICPHLASGTKWRSRVMLCNPNSADAEVTLSCHMSDGHALLPVNLEIPAWGSRAEDLGELFRAQTDRLDGGYLFLDSTLPLSVFLLYDGTASGYSWKAGLSAVPLD